MSDKEEIEELEELDDLDLSEDDSTIILLEDEDGNEIPFEFLDLIEYENAEYVVLLALDDGMSEDEEDEVVILKLETTSEDEETYVGVDDEAVLDAVFEVFKQRNNDRFNFVD